MRGRVLVVDDAPLPRRALAMELRDAGFSVIEATNGEEGWERFCQHAPDVVITDVVMPRADGLELLGRVRAQSEVPVILFTARGSVQAAASAFKAGADDFVSSPDLEIEDLVDLVTRAASQEPSRAEHPDLERRFVGKTRPMLRVRDQLSGLAPLRMPVLVAGEPGTGRDSAVRALHELGATAGGTLVRVAPDIDPQIPPPAEAVYLDGIEDFSGEARAFWAERLAEADAGGFRAAPRIFASTAEPLAVLAEDPDFRQGSGRTLLRFTVELPPLRAIRDDIPEIGADLVDRIGAKLGRRIRLSPAALRHLAAQRWPGNFVQLERLIERAITFSRGRQIRREMIVDLLAESEQSLDRIRDQRTARERDELLRTLRDTGGNISRTAEALNRSRSAIYRLIAKHGIALRRSR